MELSQGAHGLISSSSLVGQHSVAPALGGMSGQIADSAGKITAYFSMGSSAGLSLQAPSTQAGRLKPSVANTAKSAIAAQTLKSDE